MCTPSGRQIWALATPDGPRGLLDQNGIISIHHNSDKTLRRATIGEHICLLAITFRLVGCGKVTLPPWLTRT